MIDFDKLSILELIRDQEGWRQLISSPPYNVKLKEDGDLAILKYNQIKSKRCKLTSSCRGCIIDTPKLEYVCRPFERFFNHGEVEASIIDWAGVLAREKADGSIIKVFHHKGAWRIATNNTINAFNAELSLPFTSDEGFSVTSFGALFINTMMVNYNIQSFEFLDGLEDETAIFELCTPSNRVVVRYGSPKIFYLSSKNNLTGEEFQHDAISSLVDTPKEYSIGSLEECIELVETFGADKEGLVVNDKHFNRIKIKSNFYINLHHMRGEGAFTYKRALDIIRSNEIAEVLTYFPEFESVLIEVKNKYEDILTEAKQVMFEISNYPDEVLNDRKAFAGLVTKTDFADMCFTWLDKKITVEEYFENTPSDKLLGRM